MSETKKIVKEDEITLKDLILKLGTWRRYLLSKWKTIVLIGLLGAVLGLAYSFTSNYKYTAELSFALDDDKSGSGGLGMAAGLASQFGVDLGTGGGGSAFTGDNLLELMKSRSMVEKTLLAKITLNDKQETLAQYYMWFTEFYKHHPALSNIKYPIGADRTHFSRQQDSVLGVFYDALTKKSLSVDKVDKKLSIITVKVKSENELFSKYFAEYLVKNVSDFYIETKTKKSSRNIAILQHQTDSVRVQLNAAISGMAASSDVNPNPNPSLQVIKVPLMRKQVDVQANTAILTELIKNLEISKMTLRKEIPLVQIIDKPILPLDKEHFGKIKGFVLGGLLFGFCAALHLLMRKLIKDVLG